ncbi:hypothetical protein NQZ68_005083 [Dissostichus eleginoides]|nr:hypothetical protein NQZ68_005083 [Dissostichus eleginoides]
MKDVAEAGGLSDSSGFLTRFSGSNDEKCSFSSSSAATTQMATLSALQIDREGRSMRQCVEVIHLLTVSFMGLRGGEYSDTRVPPSGGEEEVTE